MLGKIAQRPGPLIQSEEPSREHRKDMRYQGVYAEYAMIEFEDDLDDDRLRFKAGFIRDFSFGGSSLQVYDNLSENILILLRLYDPNVIKPIEILSGLVWKRLETNRAANNRERFNVGFKHLYIDGDNTRALNRMIEYFESLRPKESGILEYI